MAIVMLHKENDSDGPRRKRARGERRGKWPTGTQIKTSMGSRALGTTDDDYEIAIHCKFESQQKHVIHLTGISNLPMSNPVPKLIYVFAISVGDESGVCFPIK